MHTEVEVQFLDINPIDFRAKLERLGANLVTPERLMRRRNFDFPQAREKKAWVRVRDEGDKITLSYKQTNNYTATGTKEINLGIDDFDQAVEFMHAIGLINKSYQETKRESWELDGVQVEIDTWPWIPTFVELEGDSEPTLKQLAKKLGLDWNKHIAGDVSSTFGKYYDFDPHDLFFQDIFFSDIPAWLKPKSALAK